MDRQAFSALLSDPALGPWLEGLPSALAEREKERHGHLPLWRDLLARLPPLSPSIVDLAAPRLRIGSAADCSPEERELIESLLLQLSPWRKGPFELFGIHLDSEWRSDLKWARLEGRIADLSGRRVLDVGCGNGYYGWRMVGCGASLVIGIDPTPLYAIQYQAIRRYLPPLPFHLLPLGIEELPPLPAFDTLFSMGVLYHRRDPRAHLSQLGGFLRPGGELVLETLVVPGGPGVQLQPEGRYAKMKNVHAIPSVPTLMEWLDAAGYRGIRCVDLTPTTPAEQRSTRWMTFESLADFLDPDDPERTIEGHPAPVRALLLAER